MNRAYEGEVDFLPADKSNGHPQDGNMCFTGWVHLRQPATQAGDPLVPLHVQCDCGHQKIVMVKIKEYLNP